MDERNVGSSTLLRTSRQTYARACMYPFCNKVIAANKFLTSNDIVAICGALPVRGVHLMFTDSVGGKYGGWLASRR